MPQAAKQEKTLRRVHSHVHKMRRKRDLRRELVDWNGVIVVRSAAIERCDLVVTNTSLVDVEVVSRQNESIGWKKVKR